MDWTMVTGVGTVVSAFVVLAGVSVAIMELDHMARDRHVTATNLLIEIWESPEFQRAQLWILYELKSPSWEEFVAEHGGKDGEQALIIVGSYYNHLGTLIHDGLL